MGRIPTLAVGAGVLAALTACGLTEPDGVRRTFEVAPHKVVCSGLWYGLCLRVREPGQADWTLMYETPRGFTFEWGVTTRIVVDEVELENPPLDASRFRRTLVRVEAREARPADSLFVLRLPGEVTESPEPGVHTLPFAADTPPLRCAAPQDCDGLALALAGSDAVEVTLVVPGPAGDPFRVVGWRPCGELWPGCGPLGGR